MTLIFEAASSGWDRLYPWIGYGGESLREILSASPHAPVGHPLPLILVPAETHSDRLEMAQLLHRLESGLRRSTGASERLKAQVARIDEYMRTQAASTMSSRRPSFNHENMQNSVNAQQDSIASMHAPLSGFEDPLTQFQLPPELLDDWPWSFDTSMPEGVFPMPFIK
jgi:hypothetical protein